jgi:hypothetical protein
VPNIESRDHRPRCHSVARRAARIRGLHPEFVTAVQAAKKAGQTIDDVIKTWKVPDRFKGYAPAQALFVRAKRRGDLRGDSVGRQAASLATLLTQWPR